MRTLSLVLIALSIGIAAAEPAKPGKPAPAKTARGAGDAPAIELADAVAKARSWCHGSDARGCSAELRA